MKHSGFLDIIGQIHKKHHNRKEKQPDDPQIPQPECDESGRNDPFSISETRVGFAAVRQR
jgi:hypothetical protein